VTPRYVGTGLACRGGRYTGWVLFYYCFAYLTLLVLGDWSKGEGFVLVIVNLMYCIKFTFYEFPWRKLFFDSHYYLHETTTTITTGICFVRNLRRKVLLSRTR